MPQNIYDNRISDSGIARISLKDATRLGKYRVRTGDIVYSRRGDVERCALVRDHEDGWLCGTGCLRVRVGHGYLVQKYTYYYLRHLRVREWIVRHALGATMPNLNTSILSACPIAVPPLATQQAIACILGALDDKIDLNRTMSQTLEAMARAIFKSWFVDFDPVRGKVAGQEPQGLKPEIAALFPDGFEESELGEIPKGWEVQSFTKGIDVIGGGTPKTSVPEYWGGSIPWFSVVDTPQSGEIFVTSTAKTITQDGVENSSTRLLPIGTTIISARGTVGNLALVAIPMAMNQSCYGLNAGSKQNGYYLYFLSVNAVETLRQRTHGSVFSTITRDTLNSVQIVAPPNELIFAFEKIVGSLLQRILLGVQESRTLAALRDALLPKLISGELRIKQAERIIGRMG